MCAVVVVIFCCCCCITLLTHAHAGRIIRVYVDESGPQNPRFIQSAHAITHGLTLMECKMREYKTAKGLTQFKPTLGVDVSEDDFEDDVGWCLACGEAQRGVEPDARKYTCEGCSLPKVYGLTELALMGLVDTSAGAKTGPPLEAD